MVLINNRRRKPSKTEIVADISKNISREDIRKMSTCPKCGSTQFTKDMMFGLIRCTKCDWQTSMMTSWWLTLITSLIVIMNMY